MIDKIKCMVLGHTDQKMRGFEFNADGGHEYERCLRCDKEWRIDE